MKNILFTLTIVIVIFLTFPKDTTAQENRKLAQTGLKFLSVSTDARAAGMSDANTTLNMGSASMFYNTSTMAEMNGLVAFSFGTTRWIADINYYHASIAVRPFDGDYGIIGMFVEGVDYGEFQGTIFAGNDDGYLDVGTFRPNALAFGFGYAKSLSEKFSIGGNVKYVRQYLGTSVVSFDNSGNTISETNAIDAAAFDFGILYHTGFKSLDFGMSVRNFSTELKYKEESFQLPLNFRIGISMNLFDLTDIDRNMHSLLLSIDASHPRDFAEQLFIGGEYTFINKFSIRAGYEFPKDEGGFSAGFGIMEQLSGINMGIDYSYTDFGIFNDTNNLFGGFNGIHRLTIKFSY